MDKYYICGYNIKEVQNVMLEIALEIKRICDKNNISYVLDGGTLLGAIRHGGFIPWDDDLDIAMTRENYEKFLSCCKKDLKKQFFIQNLKTDRNYPFDFTKIKKRKTVYSEKCMEGLSLEDGVYVDVFPIDNTYQNRWKKQGKSLSFWRNVRWNKIKYCLQPLYKKIITFPFKILSINFINKMANKSLLKFKDANTGYVCKICHPGPKKPAESISLYTNTIPVKFEGHEFLIPENFEQLLINRYGNYLELPPIEHRKSTHGILKVKL